MQMKCDLQLEIYCYNAEGYCYFNLPVIQSHVEGIEISPAITL